MNQDKPHEAAKSLDQLARSYRNADGTVFEDLRGACRPVILRACAGVFGPGRSELLEDVVSLVDEELLKLAQSPWDPDRPFQPYLSRIARHRALRVRDAQIEGRQRAAQEVGNAEGTGREAGPIAQVLDDVMAVAKGVSRRECEELVLRALPMLPKYLRPTLERIMAGDSQADAARHLGFHPSNIKRHLEKAREFLKQIIGSTSKIDFPGNTSRPGPQGPRYRNRKS